MIGLGWVFFLGFVIIGFVVLVIALMQKNSLAETEESYAPARLLKIKPNKGFSIHRAEKDYEGNFRFPNRNDASTEYIRTKPGAFSKEVPIEYDATDCMQLDDMHGSMLISGLKNLGSVNQDELDALKEDNKKKDNIIANLQAEVNDLTFKEEQRQDHFIERSKGAVINFYEPKTKGGTKK